jgi:hypothetical protein
MIDKGYEFAGVVLGQRFRLFIHDVVAQGDEIIPLKRWLKLGQMIDGTADSPYVYLEIVWLLLHDLRRQIQRCTHSRILLHRVL